MIVIDLHSKYHSKNLKEKTNGGKSGKRILTILKTNI